MPSLPKQKEQTTHPAVPRWVIAVLVALLSLGALLTVFVFVFAASYDNQLFPGAWVGSVQVGGQTPAEAQRVLQSRMDSLLDGGITLVYEGKPFAVRSSIEDPANPELSSPLITYNAEETITAMMAEQQRRIEVERVLYWMAGWQVTPAYHLDEEKLLTQLQDQLGQYEQPAVDAELVVNADDTMTITAEKSGRAFNYDLIIKRIATNVATLSDNTITIQLEEDEPEITKSQAEPLIETVRQVLATAPFVLVYDDRSWELSGEQLRQWLEFQPVDSVPTVGLDRASLGNYLKNIADEINVPVKEGKFVMADGKVKEFQPSQKGLALQIAESAVIINEKIKQVGVKEIDLVVQETEPATTIGDVNNLGIKELIGVGHSNFKGSPKNRRHNISVGANTLNGILIKPGEEFSLVKALGKVEASTGYLPELVIKGNKTIPEFGGGLCQIGTTTFRVALDAGLPITARTNHSYRVGYYEPAGTDATIYDPKPDFRFINDTGHYILFTTEMTGDDLYFRFYGTKDGRKVEQTKPRIFNLVKPGPTNYIETTDLKPGEKKCIEKAHTGADTEFTRTVVYPNGEKKVDVFKSHYKPWREVCLIGVEKLSGEQAEQ